MKTPFAFLAAALLCGVLSVRAEDAAPAKNPLGPVQDIGTIPADTAPSLFPSTGTAPQPVAPFAEPTPLPSPSPEATPAPSPAEKKGSIEQLRAAIRIRELKTVVQEDAQVQAELAKANGAKTPEGKRVLMRNYYTLLYTKMEKLDPSLTETLERELYHHLLRFEQHSIRPTPLIENVTPLPGSCSSDHAPADAASEPTPKPERRKAKRF